MKKVLLLAALTGFLASCKKAYTCLCVTGAVTLSNESIGKQTKKDAEKVCEGRSNSTFNITCTATEK